VRNASHWGHRRLGPSLLSAWSILCLAVGCSWPEPPRSEVLRPVKTLVVAAGYEPHVRVFPGRVDVSTTAQLAFRVSGLLARLPVREGQNVKGEVIAQLQAAQGQLDQARAALNALQLGERPEERLRREAQVRAAEARLANARAEFERYAQLVQRNFVARADYDRAETAYRVAQKDHRAALQVIEQGTIPRQEDIEAQEVQVRVLESRVVEASLQLQEDSTALAP
jgi:multidrug efflux system membrane fusion protein